MIHADNTTFWFGVVEDVNDLNKDGRYRVRVWGYNTENRGVLPTDMLKWFQSLNPNSASISGIGISPTGYEVGTMVFGAYIDADKQEGIIIGAIGGKDDVSGIAKGEPGAYLSALMSSVVTGVNDSRGEQWSEPSTSYATKYPNNKVLTTKSGHVVEFDDTPGSERIMVFHKSGTFTEFHPDGRKVDKLTNDSFSIHLGDHNIYVNGSLNLVASGDYRVSVGGEYHVKASNIIFDTPVVDIYGVSNANDHVSSSVSGADHIHSGVQPGNGNSAPPVGKQTAFAPTPANNFFLQVEDTGYTPEAIQYALDNGFMTEQDVIELEEAEPIIDSIDETPTVQTKPVITECGIAVGSDGKVDYNVQLSEHYKLRDVSIAAVVSQYTIKDQVGLTKEDIICNLKNICENVLEPLLAKYPNMIVTSAFRHGTNSSQHNKGEAVDIQFTGASKNFYYEAAQWVKNNLPYDQFLLEYKTSGTKLPWLHISLKKGKSQRYQVMTFLNHRKAADGLVKLQ